MAANEDNLYQMEIIKTTNTDLCGPAYLNPRIEVTESRSMAISFNSFEFKTGSQDICSLFLLTQCIKIKIKI